MQNILFVDSFLGSAIKQCKRKKNINNNHLSGLGNKHLQIFVSPTFDIYLEETRKDFFKKKGLIILKRWHCKYFDEINDFKLTFITTDLYTSVLSIMILMLFH